MRVLVELTSKRLKAGLAVGGMLALAGGVSLAFTGYSPATWALLVVGLVVLCGFRLAIWWHHA